MTRVPLCAFVAVDIFRDEYPALSALLAAAPDRYHYGAKIGGKGNRSLVVAEQRDRLPGAGVYVADVFPRRVDRAAAARCTALGSEMCLAALRRGEPVSRVTMIDGTLTSHVQIGEPIPVDVDRSEPQEDYAACRRRAIRELLASAIAALDLTPAAAAVLQLVCDYGGKLAMPYAEIGRVVGVSRRTVIRAVDALQRAELLERQGGERVVGALRTGDMARIIARARCHQVAKRSTPAEPDELDEDGDDDGREYNPIPADRVEEVRRQRALDYVRAGRTTIKSYVALGCELLGLDADSYLAADGPGRRALVERGA